MVAAAVKNKPMKDFIKVYISTCDSNDEELERCERLGIKHNPEYYVDACYIKKSEVAAFHESTFESGKNGINVILNSGVELPILMNINDFYNLLNT